MDGLRGLALLGIFIVNIGAMAAPSMAFGDHSPWTGSWEQVIVMVRLFLLDGAFVFIFALLFGAGFSIMMQPRGDRPSGIGLQAYYRRLLLLGVLGLLHVSLLWWGDILMIYAVTGACLPLFRERANGTVFAWALGLILGPTLLWSGLIGLMALDPAGYREMMEAYGATIAEWVVFLTAGYTSGQWGEVAGARWAEFRYNLSATFLIFPMALGYMLLGLRFARDRRFSLGAAQDRFYEKLTRWSLAAALLGKGGYVYGIYSDGVVADISFMLGYGIGGPALGLFYCCVLRGLYRRRLGLPFAISLAAAGRLALTNYLMQSLFASLLFYGYGLGFYGQVAPSLQILFVLAFFSVQVICSVVVLQRFRKGPLEWLLRRFTYGLHRL
mgnify:CR=1 FL=1